MVELLSRCNHSLESLRKEWEGNDGILHSNSLSSLACLHTSMETELLPLSPLCCVDYAIFHTFRLWQLHFTWLVRLSTTAKFTLLLLRPSRRWRCARFLWWWAQDYVTPIEQSPRRRSSSISVLRIKVGISSSREAKRCSLPRRKKLTTW